LLEVAAAGQQTPMAVVAVVLAGIYRKQILRYLLLQPLQ
jgi:hypothetical protein